MMDSRRTKRSRQRGMMLFEVLIVVAIIAMIATGVGIAAFDQWVKAQKKDALTNARTIRAGVKTFWIEHDSECPSVERLVAEQILEEDCPRTDPWGGAWRIECEDTLVTVSSNGRDKKANTQDDIRAPSPPSAVAAREAP